MNNKKGISLIVLVITIIVMIILASAIIMSLDNTNIFNKAEEAVVKTNEKELENIAALAWADGYMEGLKGDALKQHVESNLEKQGYTKEDYLIEVTDEGATLRDKETAWVYKADENGKNTLVARGEEVLEIGDYIDYVAEGTEYTGTWQVMGASNTGELLIMSSAKAQKKAHTVSKLMGFKNFEHDLTTVYSGYDKGKATIASRAPNIEDLLNVLGTTLTITNEGTYTYYWAPNNYESDPEELYDGENRIIVIRESDGKEFEGIDHFPSFAFYDGTRCEYVQAPRTITTERKLIGTITGYNIKEIRAAEHLTEGTKAFELLFGTTDLYKRYHINHKFIYPWNNSVQYTTLYVVNGVINTNWSVSLSYEEHYSNPSGTGIAAQVYPVVELKHDVKLTGSSADGWHINE